ncbi:helix-turn-helix transcriptional regulator [Frankia sp. AgB1.9]|uniref:helix-turn-helix domain-containing protein n=1 Tax=unclassified Frankia TaxID=2632575 RepID=UPI0019343DC5|nr:MULTISPECIES: helix-turn-helix transcriptional regulator [unclassified Frankia]MBL7489731.1 helix-turn-helix transcriptional regulator [Frankia sp. AgW1.1]MBL7551941.1 helix-turn-helix transcriptional regulator [Frankia sp. AgB1.9]MBL7623220.1 helix-turn-helix transcriptional regulator [Frankia sp. AgB1.8]
MENDLPLGKRIAAFRKLRGWTQAGLAQRLNRSTSWVTKIERGERQVDSVSVLLELARALSIPLHQLTGREDPDREASPDSGTTPLRLVLDRSASLTRTVSAPRSGSVLLDEAGSLRRLYNVSDRGFSSSIPLLAELISEARTASDERDGDDRRDAAIALAHLYRLASLDLRRRGDFSRARLAIDRALLAAENTGNDLLIASVSATLTVQLMMQGNPEDGVALASDAVSLLRRLRTVNDPDSYTVIDGALHLYAAQAAARAGDSAESENLLKIATEVAAKSGVDRERHSLIFGPTNVSIQKVGIFVDAHRPHEALREATRVSADKAGSVSRKCYHYLHLARAHGMLGHDDSVIDALTAAYSAAPEFVRHDPLARERVRDLVRRRRSFDERLRRLANDVNVLD